MTEPTGVGILGLGSIGRTHARALAAMPEAFRLVGATRARVDDLAETGHPDARVFASEAELITSVDVDVVVVASPSDLHGSQVLDALRAGKHIVVEKPIATSEQDVAAIEQVLSASDRLVSVIAQRRFEPQHQWLKSLLDSGSLGRVILAEAFVHWHRDDEYYAAAAWRALAPGGGSLMNQALHSVDLLDWLVGPVESVAAYTATLGHDIEAEDTSAVALRLEDGGLGLLASTTAIRSGEPATLAIRTDRGSVELAHTDIVRWEFPGIEVPASGTATATGASDPAAIGIAGHITQWRDVAEAMRTGRAAAVTAADGLRTVQLIQAIYRSAQTGTRTKVAR